MIKVELKPSLKRDVDSVCGGLYGMNAPHLKFYLFAKHKSGKSIAWGMFGDISDRDVNKFDYIVELKTGTTYLLESKDCQTINPKA